jgi:tellurite resistance protein TehA-like permease
MLSGTLASSIAASQPLEHRLTIVIAGITFQGLGWMASFIMDAMYLHRLIQYGLPAPDIRPGQFILVGPPSFTSLALIGLAKALPKDFDYFALHPLAYEVLNTVALFVAIFLWALAFWFFCISLLAVLHGVRKMSFHLVWWAFVFPNTGFAIATISIGEELGSEGILWIGSVMTILLVAMWLFVLAFHVKAVITRQIMMPGKDEDKDQYLDEATADKNK